MDPTTKQLQMDLAAARKDAAKWRKLAERAGTALTTLVIRTNNASYPFYLPTKAEMLAAERVNDAIADTFEREVAAARDGGAR